MRRSRKSSPFAHAAIAVLVRANALAQIDDCGRPLAAVRADACWIIHRRRTDHARINNWRWIRFTCVLLAAVERQLSQRLMARGSGAEKSLGQYLSASKCRNRPTRCFMGHLSESQIICISRRDGAGVGGSRCGLANANSRSPPSTHGNFGAHSDAQDTLGQIHVCSRMKMTCDVQTELGGEKRDYQRQTRLILLFTSLSARGNSSKPIVEDSELAACHILTICDVFAKPTLGNLFHGR